MDKEVQATSPDRVFRLIYRSRNTIPAQDRKVALGKLFGQARSRNKSQHITGALLVSATGSRRCSRAKKPPSVNCTINWR